MRTKSPLGGNILDKVLLIDGNSLLNRAFYALPLLTNSSGEYTNAVYGFLNIMFKFIDEESPKLVAVAFDLKAPTKRHNLFADYKGTRKEMPAELRPQIPLLKNLLKLMGVSIFELEGYEADDCLGTLSLHYSKDYLVTIVSGDRDMLQLVGGNIRLKIPKTKAGKTQVAEYDQDIIKSEFGVEPVQMIDVKALMGDASDNIPGVPGIGEKTALKLIIEYGNLDSVLSNTAKLSKKLKESIEENKDKALLSRELAEIDRNVPLEFALVGNELNINYTSEAFDEVKRLGFKSLFDRFSSVPDVAATEIVDNFIEFSGDVSKLVNTLCEQEVVSFYTAGARIGFSYEGVSGVSCAFDRDSAEALRVFFNSDVKKAVYDLKRELHALDCFGLDLNNVHFDLSLCAYIINEDSNLGSGEADSVCHVSKTVLERMDGMLAKLNENAQISLFYDMELPLARVLFEMEKTGICVDEQLLKAYGENLDAQIEALVWDIYAYAGETFNINSTQQLSHILFDPDKLGLKAVKKTKSGYSTDAEVLDKLKGKHPIIKCIIDYRTYSKLKSTYVDGLFAALRDGKIYSSFNQTVTATGRISSSEPNLQNIPIRTEIGQKLRECFVPTPGYSFADADYSQIELRVLAHMAGDETLTNAFKNGTDIHRLTASQVLGVDYESVTELERRSAKAVNFGIIYGQQAFSLSQDLNISLKEAESYIEGYFKAYPSIGAFLDGCVNSAKERGYAETIYNRRRYVPELSASNFNTRSFGERVAKNMPIQGTAADIIKLAMIRVTNRLKAERLKSRLILQIHDELLLEVKDGEQERVHALLKQEMESFDLPLSVTVHSGMNLYEVK